MHRVRAAPVAVQGSNTSSCFSNYCGSAAAGGATFINPTITGMHSLACCRLHVCQMSDLKSVLILQITSRAVSQVLVNVMQCSGCCTTFHHSILSIPGRFDGHCL